MSAEFLEAEGHIHLANPIISEFTLCGDAFDLVTDVPGYEQRPTAKRVVTCPKCAKVIRACQGVKTREPTHAD